MIDFSVEPDFQEKLDWVKAFVQDELMPLERLIAVLRRQHGREESERSMWPWPQDSLLADHVRSLQRQVRDHGLWAMHLGPELGGPGLGQVKLCLLNEILATVSLAPAIFGTMAPDTGNMELIAHLGTPGQKERWLVPLMNGDIRSSYSMTEPQAGSDPGQFTLRATRDGDDWVLEGYKWFSSYADISSLIIVMAMTNPDAPLTERASLFLVPRETPGLDFIRNVGMLNEPLGTGEHSYIHYNQVRLPADALLGEAGKGFAGAQTRLSGGRIHHAMRAVGVAQLALDMACERVLSRETQGSLLADKQMVQEQIADSYIQLTQFRLHVLYAAWLIDQHKEYTRAVRQEIAAVKAAAPKLLLDVVYRSLHLHGSLGASNETRLGQMWMNVPWMGIVDGPTEVHKVTVARQVLRRYRPSAELFPSYHLPKEDEAAVERFAHLLGETMAAI